MELVWPIFSARAHDVWTRMGSLPVSFQSFWTVYRGLMEGLHNFPYDADFAAILVAQTNTAPTNVEGEEQDAAAEMEVDLALYQELPVGDRCINPARVAESNATFFEYVGGVSNPNLPTPLRNHVPLPSIDKEGEDELDEMDEIFLTEDEEDVDEDEEDDDFLSLAIV